MNGIPLGSDRDEGADTRLEGGGARLPQLLEGRARAREVRRRLRRDQRLALPLRPERRQAAPRPTPSGRTPGRTRCPTTPRELEVGLLGLFDPHTLADLAANFVVFETRARRDDEEAGPLPAVPGREQARAARHRGPVRPRHRLAHAGLRQEPDHALRRAEAEEHRPEEPDHLHRHRPP